MILFFSLFVGFVNLQKYCPSDVVLEADDEILVLVFDDALPTGDGVLWISFSGVLNDHFVGLYRGYSFLSLFVSIENIFREIEI